MSEKTFITNITESATLVGISAVIGFAVKKVLKKSLTNDPSTSFMNAGEWVLVMLGSIYARDYLIKQKILPQ